MLGMLESLTKAVVGVVVETPLAIATDVITMGGACTDKDEPYTATALKRVVEHAKDSVDPS